MEDKINKFIIILFIVGAIAALIYSKTENEAYPAFDEAGMEEYVKGNPNYTSPNTILQNFLKDNLKDAEEYQMTLSTNPRKWTITLSKPDKAYDIVFKPINVKHDGIWYSPWQLVQFKRRLQIFPPSFNAGYVK